MLIDNKRKISTSTRFIVLIAFFYVFLFPTSYGGHILYNIYIIKNLFAGLIILYMASKNVLLKKNLLIFISIIMILFCFTITTSLFCRPNDFRIAYASISAFLPVGLCWCIKLKNKNREEIPINWLNNVTVLVLIWGWGMVLKIEPIVTFTGNLYSQLTEEMFMNMVTLGGKPVMSFGTHSLASFFITLIFYLHCITVKENHCNIATYIYMTLLALMQIPMKSTSSVLFIAAMGVILIWAKNNKVTRLIIVVGLIITVCVGIGKGYFTEAIYILFGENSRKHGIAVRYFSGLYDGNFEMIFKYLGVGFLRSNSDYFRMNDSGPLYLLTQGNIYVLIATYWLMYKFFKNNANKYAKETFFVFFLYEFASTVTFVGTAMIMAHILTIYMINSICNKNLQT